MPTLNIIIAFLIIIEFTVKISIIPIAFINYILP